MFRKNNPIVVNPNARPGVLFKTDTSNPKVIAIVILKNITPIIETIIRLSPIIKNGNAHIVLIIAVFLIPIISERIPPQSFAEYPW